MFEEFLVFLLLHKINTTSHDYLSCSEHTMYLFSINPRAFPSQAFRGKENRLTTSYGCRQSSASVMCRVFSNTPERQSQRGKSVATDRINIFLLEKGIAAGFLYQTAALFIPNYCFSNKKLMKMLVKIHELQLNLAR